MSALASCFSSFTHWGKNMVKTVLHVLTEETNQLKLRIMPNSIIKVINLSPHNIYTGGL